MDLRKSKFHDYTLYNKRFKNNYILPDTQLPYVQNYPIVYCLFNNKKSNKRKKKSRSSTLEEEPKEAQEIVIPPEEVQVIQDDGHIHKEGELCPKCHPPTIKVIFVKKPTGGKPNQNDVNTDKFYLCSESSRQNGEVPKSCPCGKSSKVPLKESAYALYNPNPPKPSPSYKGLEDEPFGNSDSKPSKMRERHDCCIHNDFDSNSDTDCRCTGPSVPCPGVMNRKKYCVCVDSKKPLYCADCAEKEGIIPGYDPSYEPVYCDCVDFEDPTLEGLVFPHGRGKDGLCGECLKQEDGYKSQQPEILDEPLKDDNNISDDEKGRKRRSRTSSPKDKRNNKKSKRNKSKSPKKSGRSKRRRNDDSNEGGCGCCRRGLLRFVDRGSRD